MLLTLFIILGFASCKTESSLSLSNDDAKTLVVQTLNLPMKFSTIIKSGYLSSKTVELENQGYITKSWSTAAAYTYYPTDMATPYLVNDGTGKLNLRTLDIDFDNITGISINKEQQTATVRFTLKSTSVTPVGRILERINDNPQNGELVYKKFDTGWQLQSDQNTNSESMVRKIYWSNNN